jgi:hypothetical protein
MKNKLVPISFKATEEEKAQITKKAFESNMSISEYIKCRLLEDGDKDEVKLTEYEKLQLACSLKSFYFLQEIINPKMNLNNKDKIKKISLKADKYLVEQGFKTQEEFDKLYYPSSNN